MLYKSQSLNGSTEKKKHVYMFASHSHRYLEDVYNTDELEGKVLPGWIIGTAGAEQYTKTIQYGYLQVKVKPDGTIDTEFVPITRNSPPTVFGKGAEEITSYCFEQNRKDSQDRETKNCCCGESQ
jgi:hypothetical protein